MLKSCLELNNMSKFAKTRREETMYLLFTVLFWFAHYLPTPYLTVYLVERGTTAFLAGVIAGAYGIVQVLVRLPIGAMADQIRRPVRIIQSGSVAMVASALLLYLGNQSFVFLLARFVAGYSAATWVVVLSTYVGMHPERTKAESIGRATAAQYTGILAAFLLSGLIRSWFEMPALLLADVIAAVGYMVYSLILPPVKREIVAGSCSLSQSIRVVVHNRQLFKGSLLFFVAQFIVFSTALSFTANYARSQGATSFQISALAAVFSLSTLVASLLIDRGLGKVTSARNVTVIAFSLTLISCVIMPLSGKFWVLCTMQVLSGMAYGINCSVLNGFAIEDIRKEMQSAAIGYFQAFHTIAVTTAPMIMGKMVDMFGGFGQPYWILGAMSLTAICLAVVFFRAAAQKDPHRS